MIILGIDGALTTTGLCVFDTDNNDILRYSKITTKYGDIKNKSEEEKLVFICDAILALCKVWNVKLAVIEDQFLGKNAKTAMQLSRLRGAIVYSLLSNDIKIDYIHTSLINKALRNVNGCSIECEDKKMNTYCYIKSIYKNNDKVSTIGPFNNRQCKDKNSDIYDSIAIATAYGSTM